MRYIKVFESLKEDKEELKQFRETIEMIFVDLIDEGFSPQILLQQRVKSRINDYTTRLADSYDKCNVVYIRLVRHKRDGYIHNNKSEEFKHKITNCFETLQGLLDRRWNGVKIEKIVRQDAVTADDTYFHELDERIWSRDFISISITIIKKEI